VSLWSKGTTIYKAVDSGRMVPIGTAQLDAALLDHDRHLEARYGIQYSMTMSGELTFHSPEGSLTTFVQDVPFQPAPEAPLPPPIGRGKRQANRKKNKAADASRKKNRRR
jgi:hypothetical protein